VIKQGGADLAAIYVKEDCGSDAVDRADTSGLPAGRRDGARGHRLFARRLPKLVAGGSRLTDRGQTIRAVRPSLPFAKDEDSTAAITEPSFDVRAGTMTMNTKGRGVDNCGIVAEWR
jgi:hypothetical protein